MTGDVCVVAIDKKDPSAKLLFDSWQGDPTKWIYKWDTGQGLIKVLKHN